MKQEDPRYWVTIYCKRCGERYFLKGHLNEGEITTGFQRCTCDNDHEFDVQWDPIQEER